MDKKIHSAPPAHLTLIATTIPPGDFFLFAR